MLVAARPRDALVEGLVGVDELRARARCPSGARRSAASASQSQRMSSSSPRSPPAAARRTASSSSAMRHLVEVAHRPHARDRRASCRRRGRAPGARRPPAAAAPRARACGSCRTAPRAAARRAAARRAARRAAAARAARRRPSRPARCGGGAGSTVPPSIAGPLSVERRNGCPKASIGGCVTPPPICPMPGRTCAMPVWTGGRMPVATTVPRVDAEDRRRAARQAHAAGGRRPRSRAGAR